MTALRAAEREPALPFLAHFGFFENPFLVTPSPRFTYVTPSTEQALDHTRQGIAGRMGLVAITGEIGTGKTTLAGLTADEAQQTGHSVALLDTVPGGRRQTESKIFCAIAADLEIGAVSSRSADKARAAILDLAMKQAEKDRTVVVFIDEAHLLGSIGIGVVKSLLSMQTASAHLVQVILFGQLPEMADVLKADRALHSRLAVHTRLNPLVRNDVKEMIEHRCEMGGRKKSPFPPAAIEALYAASKGIPRAICTIAGNACMLAAEAKSDSVTVDFVKRAATALYHPE